MKKNPRYTFRTQVLGRDEFMVIGRDEETKIEEFSQHRYSEIYILESTGVDWNKDIEDALILRLKKLETTKQ